MIVLCAQLTGSHAHSCSIPCYKAHKAIHETLTAPSRLKLTKAPQLAAANSATQPASESRPPKDLQTTSRAVLDSPLYKTLLSRYPNLQIDLLKIYKATLEPPEGETRDRSKGRGRGRDRPSRRGRQWDPEKGRKEALRLLQKIREWNEGVREFGEVVKIVMKPEEVGK